MSNSPIWIWWKRRKKAPRPNLAKTKEFPVIFSAKMMYFYYHLEENGKEDQLKMLEQKKDFSQCKNMIEFLLLSLSKHLNIRPKQVSFAKFYPLKGDS